jgi:hypothetical protein
MEGKVSSGKTLITAIVIMKIRFNEVPNLGVVKMKNHVSLELEIATVIVKMFV